MPRQRPKNLEEVFCEQLGIKPGFIKAIERDSDWGFSIKAHALIEAALTGLLVARFREPMLRRILTNLGTSSEEFSKVAILKELGIVRKEHRTFVRAFSRVRNEFAHEINNIDGTLEEYCARDLQRAKELKKAIAGVIGDPVLEGRTIPKDRFIAEHLRTALWVAVLGTVNALVKGVSLHQTARIETTL